MVNRQVTPCPAWADFLVFKKRFDQSLSDIASARRGRSLVRESVAGGVTRVETVRREAGLYTLDVRVQIDEGLKLLTTGIVGEWLSALRNSSLNQITAPGFLAFRNEVMAPGAGASNLAEWHKVCAYQARERELRFFGEYAVIHAMVYHGVWAPHSTTVADVKRVVKRQVALQTSVEKLMADRYLRRHLSAQDLAAVTRLLELLEGLKESFEFVVREAPDLHPFDRFHVDDARGERQAVAAELFDLCLLCFDRCDAKLLSQLLESVGIVLPSALSGWLSDQVRNAEAHIASQKALNKVINAKLPIDHVDDPRRPVYAVLPWLDRALGESVVVKDCEPKGG